MADYMQNAYTTVARLSKQAVPTTGVTGLGSERWAQVEPPFTELCRTTRLFTATLAQLANGSAPTQDVPTTGPDHALYNNAPSDSNRYIVPVHIAWTFSNTGTTPAMGAAGATMYGGVSALRIATPPTANGTGWTIQANRGTGTSVGLCQVGPTFAAGTTWTLFEGAPFASAASVTGPGRGFPVWGQFLVPPRFAFGFGVISGAGTNPLFCFTVIFAEVELDLD